MTAAQALQVLESHAVFTEEREALEVLRARLTPKPRKPKGCPIAAAALKACKRPPSWSESPHGQETMYLDTFGEKGSPEREAQLARLRAMPTYSQFAYEGMPSTVKDPAAQRTFLLARMEQFEREDERARQEIIRARVREECRTLQRWAERNRPNERRWHPAVGPPRVQAAA